MSVRPPAPRPCGSCPYRRDVPSGVWDEEEYAKLPAYDGETWEQPPGVFMCHQQDGRMCAGWTACHDMNESLAFRLAVLAGTIAPDDVDAVREYETPTPLFATGAEAAAHGRREIDAPGESAQRAMEKLKRRL